MTAAARALVAAAFAAFVGLAAFGAMPSTVSAATPALISGQQATLTGTGVSSIGALNLAAIPTIGNVLVMVGGNSSCALSGVSGGGVNTWQKARSSTTNDKLEIWYGSVDTATNGVTVTAGCTGAMRMNLTEWSGVTLTVETSAAQAGTTSPASAGSITTATANDLVIFGVADASGNTIGTPTGSWTAMTTVTAAPAIQKSWSQVPVAGTYSPSSTDTGTLSWDAVIAALKPCPTTVSDPGYVTSNAQSGKVNIYWSTPNQVMIARNTTNSFGTPAAGTVYAVNASLPTAGTVIFNGAAGSFTETIANGTYYYKIFTNCGRTYSAGAVLTVIPGNGNVAAWSYGTQATTLAAAGIDDNNAVVFGDNNGKVYGANAADGSLEYPVFTSPTNSIQSRPTLIPLSYSVTGKNVAYVSALDGFVYAIDTATGAQLWKSAVPGQNNQLASSPAVWLQQIAGLAICGAVTDVVFVGQRNPGAANNSVYALNAGTSNATSNGLGNCRTPSNTAVAPGDWLWKFTGATSGTPNMDAVIASSLVDYTNNVLWVTTNSFNGTNYNSQPSLWKLNVTTGQLANGTTSCGTGASTSCWNLGQTDSPPSMSGDGTWIYVGTNCIGSSCATQAATLNAVQISTGTVKTYNPGTGGNFGTGNIRGPYPLRWSSFGTTSTIARVGAPVTTVQNTSSASCVTPSMSLTAGNTVILVISAPSNFFSLPSPVVKVTAVTDSSNGANVYSRRVSMGVTAGPAGVEIWSATVGQSGSTTVTVGWSAATVSTCSLLQYSGVGAVGNWSQQFSTLSTNPTVASLATLDTNNWVVGAFGVAGTTLATSLTGTLVQTNTITGAAMAITENSTATKGGTVTNAITYAKKAWGAAAVELRSVAADTIVYSRDQTTHAIQFTGSTGQFDQIWILNPGVNVGTPVDDGAGRVWIAVGQGTIYQLDSWSGGQGIWWKSITPAASTVQLGDVSYDGISGRIYVGGSDGRMYGINVPF